MKRIVVFLYSIFICVSLVGCSNNASAQINSMNHSTFDEAKAISMVIKDHSDFPSNPTDIVAKKLPTGGMEGATANVKFTTKVVKGSEAIYVVTLTKDWGITVNNKYVKSYWKYNVTTNGVTLLDSVDNDYIPNTMK
jgi:hypothetical protein